MKHLDNVTLSMLDGYGRSKEHLAIIDKCCEGITFGKKVLVTTDPNIDDLSNERDDVEFHLINRMNLIEYSSFLCNRLPDYITTEYTLYVQEDGYILHPNSWSDEFLKYDYIGVPWLYEDGSPHHFCGSLNDVVGCGGFSLRSKRFMDLSASLNYDGTGPLEDVFLCTSRYAKNFMIDSGMKYAPVDVAFRFGTGLATVESIEKFIELGMVDKNYPPLGFHGVLDEDGYLKFWEK